MFKQADAESLIDVEQVSDAIRELEHETRQIVVARIWGGLTFDEIAADAGCSSSSAHRRYQLALEQLRERLGLNRLAGK